MTMKCEQGRLIAGNGVERFQVWIYQTSHPAEAFVSDNYFLGAHRQLMKGDVIDAYSHTEKRVQYMRILVSRSDRERVVVVPFVQRDKAEDMGEFEIFEAPLSDKRPTVPPAPQPDDPNDVKWLDLKFVVGDEYQIINGNGDAVVEGIKGSDYAAELLGRVKNGGLSLAGAIEEAKRAAEAKAA